LLGIFVLGILVLSSVGIVSAQGFLPDVADVGESGCVEASGTCGKEANDPDEPTDPGSTNVVDSDGKSTSRPAGEVVKDMNGELNVICGYACNYAKLDPQGKEELLAWLPGLERFDEWASSRDSPLPEEVLEGIRGLKERVGESPLKVSGRTFRPLNYPFNPQYDPWARFGSENPISAHGYPEASYLAQQANPTLIIKGSDGKFYLETKTGRAVFEGFGIHQGAADIPPSINPSTLSVSGGSSGFSGRITGAESWATTSVDTVIDPVTGEETLVPSIDVDDNAPLGKQDLAFVIEQNGVVIETIPFVADVQPPIFRPTKKPTTKINPTVKIIMWLIVLTVLFQLGRRMFKKKEKVNEKVKVKTK